MNSFKQSKQSPKVAVFDLSRKSFSLKIAKSSIVFSDKKCLVLRYHFDFYYQLNSTVLSSNIMARHVGVIIPNVKKSFDILKSSR